MMCESKIQYKFIGIINSILYSFISITVHYGIKIYLIATTSIFAFALIAEAITAAFVSVLAQGEGGDSGGMPGGEGMTGAVE